jgi:hypothetical protein
LLTKGNIIAETPSIKKILAILLHNILPIAIAVCPVVLANKFTTSSGIDVPKATIVSQITIEEILALLAIETEPSTSKSAPFIRNTKPTTNNIYVSIQNKKQIKIIIRYI